MKRKGKIRAGIAALLVIAAGVVVWNAWFSATRIAFVNYQVITLGQIARANDNDRIRLAAFDAEELDDIGKYDMVLVNGMGLRRQPMMGCASLPRWRPIPPTPLFRRTR